MELERPLLDKKWGIIRINETQWDMQQNILNKGTSGYLPIHKNYTSVQ